MVKTYYQLTINLLSLMIHVWTLREYSCQIWANCPCLWEFMFAIQRLSSQDLGTFVIVASVPQFQRDEYAGYSLSVDDADFKLPCIHSIRFGSCSESRTQM